MSKRVLLIGHSGDMYGASRSLAKLARILDKEHHVFVMLPERGPLYDVLASIIPANRIILYPELYIFTRKSFKLKFIPGTGVKFVKNVVAIRNMIRKHRIDIVHTNSGVVPAPALAAKLAGIKHLWHIREWFGDFKKFWPQYSAYMISLSDKIICVSETMASQFNNTGKILSIYNGFPMPEITTKPEISPELQNSLNDADLILGCTSRIRLIRKGQEFLIEAIGMLAKKTGKKIDLVLIGDYVPGYEFEQRIITNLIQKHDLEKHIHFLGHLKDPLPYYSLFDVFVLPSGEPEPFGGVVMEAMSMGLPIIGSNLGGTTEQVKDGWNGYLFENRNPDDLANKIELFLMDKEKLKVFGERSKERVVEMFSLGLHERRILELYNSL
ncbi:glycosyltransferase family 4 protein [Daejeonella lutea]|uniref:Glycosyltransferase involved in cell wall bisynthesis n=1 Tax=Daejeonella lutea TaxID=572036 RepID=A0A1T5FAG2_9SPHI|nr:glycosyltransferase family 4 protein [Daejeonella lutea]SKB93122.1 Glycosyltransferase involved in cell wall bisynthesis [Daejeonella lutea]